MSNKEKEFEMLKEQAKDLLKEVKMKRLDPEEGRKLELQNGPTPQPIDDDTRKIMDVLATKHLYAEVWAPKIEYQTSNISGTTVNTKAVYRDITDANNGDKIVGTLHQVIDLADNTNKISFAVVNKDNGYQDYYAVDLYGNVIMENELTPESFEVEEIDPQLSKYSTCKSICGKVCNTSLKITFGACIAACVETGPGEIFCAPLCWLMQWATCKLGCARICAPFK